MEEKRYRNRKKGSYGWRRGKKRDEGLRRRQTNGRRWVQREGEVQGETNRSRKFQDGEFAALGACRSCEVRRPRRKRRRSEGREEGRENEGIEWNGIVW